mgnify:FL=1
MYQEPGEPVSELPCVPQRRRSDREQFARDRFEQRCPALRRSPLRKLSQASSHSLEKCPARYQRYDCGVQQGLDDLRLRTRHLFKMVVALELFEEQLDLLPQGVGGLHVLGGELPGSDVRDVQMVLAGCLVAQSDDTEQPLSPIV